MERLVLLLGIAVGVFPAGAETAGGIQWTAPSGWRSLGSRPMRAATYSVPAATGDKEDGECAVYYFGPGQGGSVDANVKRWIGQFEPIDKAAEVRKQTINGLPVTTIDISGTYLGAGGPMAPGKIKKPGYRLLGAIVEGPQGLVFFKFTGLAKTVAAAHSAFASMLKSLRK
jgi:hypothetical protein